MENPANKPDIPAIRLVEKPKSKWTAMLNGAGNGAMIGGIGLIGYEFIKNGKKEQLKDRTFLILAGAAGIATAIGGMYGLHEAKQNNIWRTALAKDIETLHAQNDRIESRINR